jgi:hypothetical protein
MFYKLLQILLINLVKITSKFHTEVEFKTLGLWTDYHGEFVGTCMIDIHAKFHTP